jgi:hypothetical protein
MHLGLLAAAFWCEPDEDGALQNAKTLVAIEEFSSLVNAYVQSLPMRVDAETQPDVANRYFRAMQRRRYGMDATLREPRSLAKRLPMDAQHIVDTYSDQLFYGTRDAARRYGATVAAALGRPIDDTVVNQLEIALATAIMWRNNHGLPEDNSHDPIIGPRTFENEHEWGPISEVVDGALDALASRDNNTSDPALVHKAALVPVGDVQLDGPSLSGLQRLDDYIHLFATWILQGDGRTVPAGDRLRVFDNRLRGADGNSVTNGAHLLGSLPGPALKVIANVDALQARNRSADSVANELAMALGDTSWSKRLGRSLSVAAAWLNSELSPIERAYAPDVVEISADDDPARQVDLDFLIEATPRSAESLLDLGASVVELVRFSRTLGRDGHTPPGWWQRFHMQQLGNVPTPNQLLERLPDGARSILHKYAVVLESPRLGDVTIAPRALARALGRENEVLCVRTLAVALSVGAIWNDFALAEGVSHDSLLGTEPEQQRERFVCGRAQVQLQWGLQEMLQSDSIVGV